MNDQSVNEFKLIEGQFNPDEAKNILLSLFNSKINYHQLDSFSNQIRNGNVATNSQNRILSLSESIENIKVIIAEANLSGKQVKIEGIIHISFVD